MSNQQVTAPGSHRECPFCQWGKAVRREVTVSTPLGPMPADRWNCDECGANFRPGSREWPDAEWSRAA